MEFDDSKYTVFSVVNGNKSQIICVLVVVLLTFLFHYLTDREAVQQLEARVRSARSTCGEKVGHSRLLQPRTLWLSESITLFPRLPYFLLGLHVIPLSHYAGMQRSSVQTEEGIDLETRQLSVTQLQYRFSTLFCTESDEEPGWGLHRIGLREACSRKMTLLLM